MIKACKSASLLGRARAIDWSLCGSFETSLGWFSGRFPRNIVKGNQLGGEKSEQNELFLLKINRRRCRAF